MNIKILSLLTFLFAVGSLLSCEGALPFNTKQNSTQYVWYPVGKGEVTSINYDGLKCVLYVNDGDNSISCVHGKP